MPFDDANNRSKSLIEFEKTLALLNTLIHKADISNTPHLNIW